MNPTIPNDIKAKVLISLKIKRMIDIKSLDVDLWAVVLSFGKKKQDQFRFPLIFKNYKTAERLCNELEKLKGGTIEKVRNDSDKLFDKFKQFNKK